MQSRTITCFLILCIVCFNALSQSAETKPEFVNPFNIGYIFNPATKLFGDQSVLNVAYKNRVGDFSAIRSFYALASTNPSKKQGLFLELMSDQIGPYFQKSRAYCGYNVSISLNEKWTSKVGASGGVVNYNMEASTGGTGGADFAFDANSGVTLEHENGFFIGFSLQQFLNNTIQPIYYSFLIERYSEFQTGIARNLSANTTLQAMARVLSDKRYFFYSRFVFYDDLLLGFNYNSDKVVGLFTGYKMHYVEGMDIDFFIAYALPFAVLESNKQTIEFSMSISRSE